MTLQLGCNAHNHTQHTHAQPHTHVSDKRWWEGVGTLHASRTRRSSACATSNAPASMNFVLARLPSAAVVSMRSVYVRRASLGCMAATDLTMYLPQKGVRKATNTRHYGQQQHSTHPYMMCATVLPWATIPGSSLPATWCASIVSVNSFMPRCSCVLASF